MNPAGGKVRIYYFETAVSLLANDRFLPSYDPLGASNKAYQTIMLIGQILVKYDWSMDVLA